MTSHWDEFSKSLAEESLPRRESLRRLGIALAGAVLSPLGLQTASAGHHSKPQSDPCKAFCKCRSKSQQSACLAACNACDKDTSRLCGSCGSYVCCREPGPYEFGACIDGACRYVCAEGAVYCEGACTFLGWDPANCGACGNVCPESAPYCEEGVCTDSAPCPGTQTRCSGVCYDLNNDPNNCGASCATRVVCGQFETCTGGVCVPVDPPSPEF